MIPQPIDQPAPGEDRPEPRRYTYPVSWNMPHGQPGDEGLKLAGFGQLRTLADAYSVARACINLRIQEILAIEWDIVPTKDAEKKMRGDREARRQFDERRAPIKRFFYRPDPGKYHGFEAWLSAVLEEIFVVDALSIYLQPSRQRGKGRGIPGSNLGALCLISGDIIRPMLDLRGGIPQPPNPAYQCYSSDTEILTPRGWVRFDQLTDDDDVATRSPFGAFEWQRPRARTWFPYAGDMVHFKSRNSVDVLVTPEHRMLWTKAGGARVSERIDRADAIEPWSGTGCLVATSMWDAPDREHITFSVAERATRGPAPKDLTMTGDQFAAFMGMYIAEGSTFFQEHGNYVVSIAQGKTGKGYREYEDLLVDIFGRVPGKAGDNWWIRSRALHEYLAPLGKSQTKHLPQDVLNLSRRQLEIFWRYYWLGDGCDMRGQETACTASRELADDLQEVLQKIGYSTGVREVKVHGNPLVPGERLIYKIGVRKTTHPKFHTQRVPYDGYVGCVTTDNGIVYVRRNGQPVWCGNCYQYGVPRVDLMTTWMGEDVKDMEDALTAQYRADQLMYLPYTPRSWTPYGFSIIEQALVPITSGLQRQQWQLQYYSEGSVPGVFLSTGDPNSTPNQCRELQDALNAMAGDPKFKHQIIVVPGGAKIDPMRPTPLADQFDEIVMTQVCMAAGVMPSELGVSSSGTRNAMGAASNLAKANEAINHRKALKPLLKWLASNVFDYAIRDLMHQDDMQWHWEGLEEGEDEGAAVDVLVNEVSHGGLSIDEMRVIRGHQPWGIPLTSEPVYFTPTGVVPLGSIDMATGAPVGAPPTNAMQAAAGVVPGAPPQFGPGGGPPGVAGGKPPKGGKGGPKKSIGAGPAGPAPTPAHAGAQAAIAAEPTPPPPKPMKLGKPVLAHQDPESPLDRKPVNKTMRATARWRVREALLGKVRLPPGPRDWKEHPWSHGWVWHGPTTVGTVIDHKGFGKGKVTGTTKTRIKVMFPDGKERTFPHAAGVAAGRPTERKPHVVGETSPATSAKPRTPRKTTAPKETTPKKTPTPRKTAPKAPAASREKPQGTVNASVRRTATARGMEISSRATNEDVEHALRLDRDPASRPSMKPAEKYEGFDDSRASSFDPTPETYTVDVVVEPKGHRTTLHVPQWGEGQTQEMEGTYARVKELDDTGNSYGVAYDLFLDSYERVPGTKDQWRKSIGVDAYRAKGGERIQTILPDGKVEVAGPDGKGRVANEGDWISRKKNHGVVQIITDEKFRKIYDVPPGAPATKPSPARKLPARPMRVGATEPASGNEARAYIEDMKRNLDTKMYREYAAVNESLKTMSSAGFDRLYRARTIGSGVGGRNNTHDKARHLIEEEAKRRGVHAAPDHPSEHDHEHEHDHVSPSEKLSAAELAKYKPGEWKPGSLDSHRAERREQYLSEMKDLYRGESLPRNWKSVVDALVAEDFPSNARVYNNGPHAIHVYADEVGGADVQRMSGYLDNLLTAHPRDSRVTISVLPSGSLSTKGSVAQLGVPSIKLNAKLFEGDLVSDQGEDREAAGLGEGESWSMPMAYKVPKVQYTLTHEYGHTMDFRDDPLENEDPIYNEYQQRGLSIYGGKNPAEAYAESFAEWVLSRGKTNSAIAKAYAKKYGW